MVTNEELIRIAYADDCVAVRKGIISFITSLGGIEVVAQADDGDGLLHALEQIETPDACLLDISMPGMDGFETLGILKQRWPEMNVIVLTIYKLDYYIIRMIRNGANGYLLKSCDPEEIKKALLSVCNTGFYYSSSITSKFVQAIKANEVKLPNFTKSEIEVLKYCCSDLSYARIAEALQTTSRSVEGHRDSLFRKLNVRSRVSLAMFAVQFGLVPLDIKIPTIERFLHKHNKTDTA